MRFIVFAACAGLLLIPAAVPAQDVTSRIDRPTQPSRSSSLLHSADADGDGRVSFEELQARRPSLSRERFDRIDSDGDGFLSSADRSRTRKVRAPQDESRRRMISSILRSDKDGDGAVSYEELAAARQGFPESTFERLDANRDGVLTEDEMGKSRRGVNPRSPGENTTAPDAKRNRRATLFERLKTFDANGDERLSLEEIQSGNPRISEQRFNRLDANGDGVLTRGERLLR